MGMVTTHDLHKHPQAHESASTQRHSTVTSQAGIPGTRIRAPEYRTIRLENINRVNRTRFTTLVNIQPYVFVLFTRRQLSLFKTKYQGSR